MKRLAILALVIMAGCDKKTVAQSEQMTSEQMTSVQAAVLDAESTHIVGATNALDGLMFIDNSDAMTNYTIGGMYDASYRDVYGQVTIGPVTIDTKTGNVIFREGTTLDEQSSEFWDALERVLRIRVGAVSSD